MCCQQFSTPLPTSALYNLWMVLYLSYFLYWCYTNSKLFLYLISHCKYVKFLLLLYVIILFFIPKFLSNISGIKSNHFESKSCSTLHEIVAKDLLLTHVTALAFSNFLIAKIKIEIYNLVMLWFTYFICLCIQTFESSIITIFFCIHNVIESNLSGNCYHK